MVSAMDAAIQQQQQQLTCPSQSRAATANRYNTRVSGQFTSTATLRAQQRALLAPSSRWRKEWVRPESSSAGSATKGSGEKPSSGNPTGSGGGGYRVLKWVKYDEGGELAEEGEQPTEEQVTAAITGAKTLLEPAPTPALEPTATTAATSPAENVETAPVTEGNTPAPPPSLTAHSQSQQPSSMLAVSPGSSPAAAPPPTTTSLASAPAFTPSPLKEQQLPTANSGEAMTLSDSGRQTVQEKQLASLAPGREDDGGDMVVEAEQREHDVRMAPELVGEEAAATRAALGGFPTISIPAR